MRINHLFFAQAYPIKKTIVFQEVKFSNFIGFFAHPL
jgi:hypothetical protein